MSEPSGYGLSSLPADRTTAAPQFAFAPRHPRSYRPPIACIGAGGISEYHLRAYRQMGLNVAVICDVDLSRAQMRRDEFYPQAAVTSDFQAAIDHPGVEVVDAATHPHERVEIIEYALRAGKHVLSQKPFVLDLDVGEHLVELARSHSVQLAVNQNGRWAPHFRYIDQAIHSGQLGPVADVQFSLHWDHTWTEHTPFNQIHHLLLFDFAIHWFDIACSWLAPASPHRVYASVQRLPFQTAAPPFLAAASIEFPQALVGMQLNGHVQHGQEDRTVVACERGTLRAFGPSLNHQRVVVATSEGTAEVPLEGNWFDSGFAGTMGELLTAIEEMRTPENSAEINLRSLALCFAALKSADSGTPIEPGSVRRIPTH